jgi:hypothetical protein
MFAERVKNHVDLLKAHLTVERTLKDAGRLKEWASALRASSKNTRPVPDPYIPWTLGEPDVLLPILLREGVLKSENLDWKQLAFERFTFEEQTAASMGGEVTGHSVWPALFPASVSWTDLPADKVDLFKSWTLERAKRAQPDIVQRWGWDRYRHRGNGWVILYETQYYVLENVQTILKGAGIDIQRTEPYRPGASNWNEQVVLVYPHVRTRYVIQIPEELVPATETNDFQIEVDLAVGKVARVPGAESGPALVFVTPGEVRLRKHREVIWRGAPILEPEKR